MPETSNLDENIRSYITRIDESGCLGRGIRLPALLAYLLQAEAAKQGDKIKAYSIGLDVFGKAEDFDPTADSSVRVSVGRLRAAIAKFESSEWADTSIKVEIPVGTYQPRISERFSDANKIEASVTHDVTHQARPPVQKRMSFGFLAAILTIAAIVLFVGSTISIWRVAAPVSGPPISLVVEDFLGDPFGKELSLLVKDSFSNNTTIELLAQSPIKANDSHFILKGNITKRNELTFASVSLTNRGTQKLVWSHFFELDTSSDWREQLNTKLNGELETRLIGEAKVLLEQRDVSTLTPQQLFILGTWVSGPAVGTIEWEIERIDLMKLALKKDPNFGPAHSVLADKYGFLANVRPDWDTQENLDLSRYHAERAIELSPLDSNAMFNVAQSYWHAGRHADSQRMFRRVTELDRSNGLARFFARLMPFWCADVPDEILEWAQGFDDNLSRDDPVRWIVLTWIATLHTNREEYDLALASITEAAQIFQNGYTFMTQAMVSLKTDQPQVALAILQSKQSSWPGFSAAHYSASTAPRLCMEQSAGDRFVKNYEELAEAIGHK